MASIMDGVRIYLGFMIAGIILMVIFLLVFGGLSLIGSR